jgi:chromosome segregation ATPase
MRCSNSAILLADLAGSEGIDKTQTKGKNTLEGAKINTSLLSLSKVVKRLSQNEKYIGFRDSKLTMVLQPILIGNCLTSVICTVNTTKQTLGESINTLKFGTCAGVVQRKVDLSMLDKSLDNKIGKEVLQELDELNEKYEEAQQQLYDKQQNLDLLTQEHQALRVQVDLLQNEKHSYLKEIDKLRQDLSKMTAESSKIAHMIDEMESKIIAEKEIQFKHMFDQQNLLIKNLEEEVDRLKSLKSDMPGDTRRAVNIRDLAPCYKKSSAASIHNSSESHSVRNLMADSMETIPEEVEGLSKRHSEIITKLREDNESIREKLTQCQKENLRLSKINHLLRNDMDAMQRHIEEMDQYDRPRRQAKPIFAFDRNGDPVNSRIMSSPSKEEYKRNLKEVERKCRIVEKRLDEAREREDKCRVEHAYPRSPSTQEDGHKARRTRTAGTIMAQT